MADYDIGQAFKEIEEELIASMIRNLERHKAWEEDEGFQWDQWQVLQLQSLERYRRLNRKKFKGQFEKISQAVDDAIRAAREDGRSAAEAEILQKIKDGFADYHKASISMSRDFFRLNERKLNALISATQKDFTKAEHAILRMANDQYRKVIYSAQVYANSGAGTYEKAIDMATRDFLQAGLNCVEYKNGARHTLHDYADMAIRTATTRAYLAGEGEMRNEWGIHTVIVNKRTAACSKCMPFAGKIMIDDVYANGSRKDGPYMLVSAAIEEGFLHPRCKDTYTTYFPGLDDDKAGEPSKADKKKAAEKEEAEAKQNHAELQAEKYERLADTRLDPENKRQCEARADRWQREAEKYHIKANQSDDPFVRMVYDRRSEQMRDISKDVRLQKAFRNARFRDGEPTKQYVDITERLLNGAIDDADYGELIEYTSNGQTYRVGNPGVLQRHTDEEKSIAKLISRLTGKPVRMVPEISGKNEKVKTPDFIAGTNERWEIKDTKCSGKDPLRNEMSSKKAENYVFDVTRRVVDIEKIIEFAKQVFSAYNTTYVENVYIIENGKLVIALSKR